MSAAIPVPKQDRMRVGLLTAGGDCPGLNAVIRAVTKALVLRHGAEVLGFEDGFRGLVEGHWRPLGLGEASGILGEGGTILGTDNRATPFAYYLRDGADVSQDVLALYRDLALDGLVVLGGDGTLAVAHGLQGLGIDVIGVPKTIDNDVAGTERTVGFDTAVAVAAEATARVQTTAQSHHRVLVLEVMGRDAGWIALYAGAAAGADVILLPEIEYQLEEIARVCRAREQGRQRYTVVVAAEGACAEGCERTVLRRVQGSPEPVRLGGIGPRLAQELEDLLGVEARATVLGHVQRGGPPSPGDRLLATTFGERAAALVAARRFGRVVALQNGRLTDVPLAVSAGKTRRVSRSSPVLTAALAVGTSFGCREMPADPGGPEEPL
jgi:6-phosphofructokinase 1